MSADEARDRPELKTRLLERLFAPVDIAWLVYFRVIFAVGLLAFVYYSYELGWTYFFTEDVRILFPYDGFTWLRPLPPVWMHLTYGVLAAAAVFIGLGFLYRSAAVLAFVIYAYLFFLDEINFQNHLYLILLLAFLMIFMPANRAWSLDGRRKRSLTRSHVPFWTLALIRFQLGVVYFFGGVAKFDPEWFSLRSVRAQLADLQPTAPEWLAPLYDDLWFIHLLTWGGILFDLFIVPLLLWRRTRLLAFAAVVFFHVMNSFIFPIDLFPWFMLAATLVFFRADFPRRIWRFLRSPLRYPQLPKADALPQSATTDGGVWKPTLGRKAVLAGLLLYALVQILLPFRPFLYPGSVSWTGAGYNFSWRMRTVHHVVASQYLLTDASTGRSWLVEPRDFLAPRQPMGLRTADMYVRLGRELARDLQEDHQIEGPVEMRALILKSLNNGPFYFFFDPNADLMTGPLHEKTMEAVRLPEESWRLEDVHRQFTAELRYVLEHPVPPPRETMFRFAAPPEGHRTSEPSFETAGEIPGA